MNCLNTKKLCDNIDCKICYEKSFASIDYSINLKDKNINPRNISKYSGKKYDFICPNCNHIFNIIISSISVGNRCLYCCKSSKVLCDDDTCMNCFNKSFASSNKAELWDYDKKKIDLIKSYGYNLEVVWEGDLKLNNKLIELIIENYVTKLTSTP